MKTHPLIKTAFVALAAGLLSLQLAAQPPFERSIDEIAQAYLQNTGNQGLVIGIISNGEQAAKGYGIISRDQPSPPDGETIFEIGAVTNVFTTSLMMEASLAGHFALNEPIQGYLPEKVRAPAFYPYVCREKELPDPSGDYPERILVCEPDFAGGYFCITFCDLASHTSSLPKTPRGLYNWNPFTQQLTSTSRDISRRELYRRFAASQLDQAPGILFQYSNVGMAVLGNIIADRSGKDYQELLAEKILTPLEMNDTRLTLNSAQNRRLAPGHDRRGHPVAHLFLEAMGPAGGLHATANDLLSFLAANLKTEEGPLGEVFAQVQEPRLETTLRVRNQETQAGYGWLTTRLDEESNLPIHWINGGTEGFRAFIGLNRDRQIAVVVLSNSANPVDETGFKVLEQLAAGRIEN